VKALRRRLSWEYAFRAATTEAAKTNVSVLRRRAAEEDEEARPLFHPRRVPRAGLSAAEIGSAHHLFLQQIRFERTGSLVELRGEAGRLIAGQHVTKEQAAALDFDALLHFWRSAAGHAIRAESSWVHRELPFTASFTAGTLRKLGLATSVAADEFVVVQGVVDLAVIREDSIAILDFKTDAFPRGDLEAKTREYAPQVRLYASALARIYARPVTGMSLHFLALGETIPILDQ
jgi:ATP-dependent helicase/nuclease subunit A